MTNWNDGTIHGWNGGDCPVHPETLVRYWLRNMAIATETYRASGLRWTHRDESGDFIIKGAHGEFYPCKPDIFEKTYEEVKE